LKLANRTTPENRIEARAYLAGMLTPFGLAARRQAYSAEGENVYAVLPCGRPSAELVVIGAHYDSSRGSPGANEGARELYAAGAAALKMTIQMHVTTEAGSDHSAFRRLGFRAVGLTEEYRNKDTTPFIHRPGDTANTVDFAYLASTTRLFVKVIEMLATSRLVEDVLDFARMEEGRRQYRRDRVETTASVGDAPREADHFLRPAGAVKGPSEEAGVCAQLNGLYRRPQWSYYMVMSQSDQSIGASAFKARCLALLDRVAETGEPLVITKRGRAVARLVSARRAEPASLRGSVTFRGDIVAPVLDEWEADR